MIFFDPVYPLIIGFYLICIKIKNAIIKRIMSNSHADVVLQGDPSHVAKRMRRTCIGCILQTFPVRISLTPLNDAHTVIALHSNSSPLQCAGKPHKYLYITLLVTIRQYISDCTNPHILICIMLENNKPISEIVYVVVKLALCTET